jgi:hypothetical protein
MAHSQGTGESPSSLMLGHAVRGPVAEHPGGHRECGGSEGCEWPQVREQQVESGPFQVHPLRDIDDVLQRVDQREVLQGQGHAACRQLHAPGMGPHVAPHHACAAFACASSSQHRARPNALVAPHRRAMQDWM